MQESPFDKIAPFYDELFSDTEIGTYLKQIVQNYLDENLPKSELNILEVNCGTGVDAIYLAQKGHNVIATDQSAEMIKNAQLKLKDIRSANVIFQQMDIKDIKNNFTEEKFDLVFSNFGGLNCIDKNELKKFGNDIKGMLNPGGRVIASIMPPLSIWD
ncbi:MAG TPA: class I SAM-dependent methyltransferase, partial [Ignavibacteria bacterium]|nr:class I SAM-dependent methyltransferase [Ignavibacteria bacterium]